MHSHKRQQQIYNNGLLSRFGISPSRKHIIFFFFFKPCAPDGQTDTVYFCIAPATASLVNDRRATSDPDRK
jgi:hypothetical protein